MDQMIQSLWKPVVIRIYAVAVIAIVLGNPATARAVCNQVCADNNSNTFFGVNTGVNATGTINTGFGAGALSGKLSGQSNTAIGDNALASDTSGSNNTAAGTFALIFNTTGAHNTATGSGALFENDSGSYNTADGDSALGNNIDGANNTATGYLAMVINTSGFNNTGTGVSALQRNSSGHHNTATGENSLFTNTTGYNNTAHGGHALYSNTTGHHNAAAGYQAIYKNTTGYYNTGLGGNALYNNTTGHDNIAVGLNAGNKLTTGSNNIDIGNRGLAAESNTIRIGQQATQTATYLAGVSGVLIASGTTVVVNTSGRLGVQPSSARYKHDIRDMGTASSSLMRLRPVSFRYNGDPTGTQQYGLIAEEVEKLYPELVTHGADGNVEAVRYSSLTSMLLNELQKQNAQLSQLTQQLAEAKAAAQRQAHELETLQTSMAQRLVALERAVPASHKERTVASR